MNIRIGDLVREVGERNPADNAVVFSVSEKHGIVPQTQLFKKPIATDDRSKYKPIRFGDVIYNPYLLWNRAVGVCFDKRGGCVSPAYIVLRPRESSTERFLHYFFRSDVLTTAVDAIAAGSVTRRRTAPVSLVLDLTFNLPAPANQKVANAILCSLDDKIELNRRRNATLEAMGRALFKSWFVDFDPVRARAEGRDPGLPKPLADLFPDSFEDSELGEVPKGWRVERLSEVMTFQGGSQPPASEFIAEPHEGYVRLVQIRDFSSSKHVTFVPDTPNLRKFTTDDIMIARYGSSGNAEQSRDSLARICRGVSGAYNVALVKVVPHRPIRECLGYFLQSPAFQSVIKGMGARSVQSGFRKKDLDVISIVTGPDSVHAAFERFASNAWRRIYATNELSRTLAALRDTLLPKLISGELRVKDAERTIGERVG